MMFEFRRQLFHLFFGLTLILLIQFNIIGVRELWILFLIGVVLSIICKQYKLPLISRLLDFFERHQIKRKFPGQGPIFYVLGAFLSLVLFEERIALASIMILAVGDSVSHLAGRFYGKISHPLNSHKFLEGAIFGFCFGTIAAWIFVPFLDALVGSFVAMTLEGIDVKFGMTQIDDNLLIPVSAGLAIFLVHLLVTTI